VPSRQVRKVPLGDIPKTSDASQLASSKFCCGTRNVRYLALWNTFAVADCEFGLIKFLEHDCFELNRHGCWPTSPRLRGEVGLRSNPGEGDYPRS
jgi:hypothetical protein